MSPSAPHRLLVGILMPDKGVQTWRQALGAHVLPPHEPADPLATWLTVHFIGDVPVRNVDDVLQSVERSIQGVRPFPLMPEAIETIPRSEPARQVVLRFDLPASLREIKDRLVRRLARGRKKPADEFEPRVALARLTQPSVDLRVKFGVTGPVVQVSEVHVVRSVLMPQEYENRVVESFSL